MPCLHRDGYTQQPLKTHKLRIVLLLKLEDQIFVNTGKESGSLWFQTNDNQMSQCSPYMSTSTTAMSTMDLEISLL